MPKEAIVLCKGWLWTSWRGPAENWVGKCEGCCVGTWSTGSLSWETSVHPAVECGCSIISPHRTGSYCRWPEETPLFQMKGTVWVKKQFLVSLFKKENVMSFMVDWQIAAVTGTISRYLLSKLRYFCNVFWIKLFYSDVLKEVVGLVLLSVSWNESKKRSRMLLY